MHTMQQLFNNMYLFKQIVRTIVMVFTGQRNTDMNHVVV